MTTKCPICSSETNYVFTSKHNLKIYQCTNEECEHLFTHPLLPGQGVHERPEDIENESDRSIEIYGERNERLLRLLIDNLPEGSPEDLVFIDFGAGDAHISRTFKSHLGSKVDIYCVEEETKCKPLYSKYGLVQIDKIEEMPKKADLIYAIEVIEHVANPVSVLKTFREALAVDGIIFISTPPGHIDEQKTNAYENPTHLHFFTPLSLNLALGKAGLKPIEYRDYSEMYPLPFRLKSAQKVKQILRWGYRNLIELLEQDLISTMNMPPSSSGGRYPYHLVGFSRSIT